MSLWRPHELRTAFSIASLKGLSLSAVAWPYRSEVRRPS